MVGAERRSSEVVPVLSFGARMSWCGLLRADDPFCRPTRSRRASLVASRGPGLQRRYGAWSTRYRRFVANLSTPEIVVRVLDPGAPASGELEGIVHWVRRADVVRLGSGGLATADGWPEPLWALLVSRLEERPEVPLGAALRDLADSERLEDGSMLARWSASIRATPPDPDATSGALGLSWLPVPALFEEGGSRSVGLASWAPSAPAYPTLSRALEAARGSSGPPDLVRQAEYYFECRLAEAHGVTIAPGDGLRDPEFERRAEVASVGSALRAREQALLTEPGRGRLDRFDAAG